MYKCVSVDMGGGTDGQTITGGRGDGRTNEHHFLAGECGYGMRDGRTNEHRLEGRETSNRRFLGRSKGIALVQEGERTDKQTP